MSIYTTQVRFICETSAGFTESQGGEKISEIITKAAPKVFDFDFPMWDETYRKTLEEKILRTYYTREICEETVALWKLRLETRLNNIMPYYNQLYETTVLKFNPLYDVDYTKTHEGKGTETGDRTTTETGKNTTAQSTNTNVTNNGTEENTTTQSTNGNATNSGTEGVETNNNTTDTNNNLTKTADTPQNSISSVTGVSNNWLSQVTQQENSGTNKLTGSQNTTTKNTQETTGSLNETVNNTKNNTQESTGNLNETVDTTRNGTDKNQVSSTDEYVEHIAGKIGTGSYSKAIAEVRANIINIDLLVISELQDLFFGLWH